MSLEHLDQYRTAMTGARALFRAAPDILHGQERAVYRIGALLRESPAKFSWSRAR